MSALVLRESINHVAAQLKNPHLDDIHELMVDEVFAARMDKVCELWYELRISPSPRPLNRYRYHKNKNKRKTKNRLYNQLYDEWCPKDLSPEAEAIIWNWAIRPDSFFFNQVATTPIVGPSDHSPEIATRSMLDSVCRLLNHLDTQFTVDSIRWRLLLCFLTEFVDEQIAGVSSTAEICLLLVQRKLVSPELEQTLAANLSKLLKAGRGYLSLAKELGGWGSLVHLPPFGRTTYEHHYHPAGQTYRFAIIQRLKMQVPKAANYKRQDDRNAYEVADALRQSEEIRPWSGGQETPTPLLAYRDDVTPIAPHRRLPRPAGQWVGSSPLWQDPRYPSPADQSRWDSGDLTPDGASTTQHSFITPNGDDCHLIFPGSPAPLVV
ncbi:hypothetical protein N7471_010576 [Penicillium samsonianum]|uniref:uncharacterized protein n=1 Tax=Penicillium samsonianum TaxID=1882272 RepID=UPI00254799AF|nr:uncharacterized protein N7471_010576 [Penicillium samsonianum]KAJ6126083.1 hypothetical protein N7471_010576 [Penicillium samsonianum]